MVFTEILFHLKRLSIYGAAHPIRMIRRFNDERNVEESCDGLYARFLVYMPVPVRKRIGMLILSLNVKH
jgi:hypothetical protein